MLVSWLSAGVKKTLFVVFADFYGADTPTVAGSKLPMWCHCRQHWGRWDDYQLQHTREWMSCHTAVTLSGLPGGASGAASDMSFGCQEGRLGEGLVHCTAPPAWRETQGPFHYSFHLKSPTVSIWKAIQFPSEKSDLGRAGGKCLDAFGGLKACSFLLSLEITSKGTAEALTPCYNFQQNRIMLLCHFFLLLRTSHSHCCFCSN